MNKKFDWNMPMTKKEQLWLYAICFAFYVIIISGIYVWACWDNIKSWFIGRFKKSDVEESSED